MQALRKEKVVVAQQGAGVGEREQELSHPARRARQASRDALRGAVRCSLAVGRFARSLGALRSRWSSVVPTPEGGHAYADA